MVDNPGLFLIWVILASLANYKAAHMVSQDGDEGPFSLLQKFRDWIGTKTWIGRGFHCFSCTSFWGAFVATMLLAPVVPWNLFILVWGAIATLSFVIWRYFG